MTDDVPNGTDASEHPLQQVDPLDVALSVLSDVQERWNVEARTREEGWVPDERIRIAHAHALAATCQAIFARQLVSLQAAQLQQAGAMPVTPGGLVLPG